MSNYQKLYKFQLQLALKYAEFAKTPTRALSKINCVEQWKADQYFAITTLYKSLASSVAVSLFNTFVYKWEKYHLDKPTVITSIKQKRCWEDKSPNRWLRQRIKMIKRSAAHFPISLARLQSDNLRTLEAQVWAMKCTEFAQMYANDGLTVVAIVEEVQLLADKWGFKPLTPSQTITQDEGESLVDYKFRVDEEMAWFHLERLLSDKWWENKIKIAYRQFCEHCQIIVGRVRKNTSEYLSVAGRADYKVRQEASILALSKIVVINEETGEEVSALDIIKKSTANPAIRRCEFMVRSAGFEELAKEIGLLGGFFTLTAPSRFHACTSKNKRVFDNAKYAGATPKQTQKYLSKVWSQARAKLKRMHIHIFGFRVCEPHHDGTPHWHALFFFKPEDEQAIRFVLADYFTRKDRHELHVSRKDFKEWGKSIKAGFTTKDMFNPLMRPERKHIFSVAQRIQRRFHYKRMNPKKGSATAYIAKYISKNIDGYRLPNDEDTGTPADEKARAACGWASTWRIRQFQQIGGAPVSVWRELRKLEQTPDEEKEMNAKRETKARGEKYVSSRKIISFYDLQKQSDAIELARIYANQGSWSGYIHAMGGVFCLRKDHPIKMAYKDTQSQYGETVKKIQGITSGLKTLTTRTGNWIFTHKLDTKAGFKTGAQRPCSSDCNCTFLINEEEKQEVSCLLKERGEKSSNRVIAELLGGLDTVIEERWIGDIKRTIWGKLKRNVMNIWGNFRLRVWGTDIKRNVIYIDPPNTRFKGDRMGKRNAFFDAKPASEEVKRQRKENETYPWDEFN